MTALLSLNNDLPEVCKSTSYCLFQDCTKLASMDTFTLQIDLFFMGFVSEHLSPCNPDVRKSFGFKYFKSSPKIVAPFSQDGELSLEQTFNRSLRFFCLTCLDAAK